jgi:hypothetical protein
VSATVRFHAALRSARASSVPGDTLRRLTRAATASDGRVYAAGTTFRPLSCGEDWAAGKRYQDVSIIRVAP